MMTKRAAFQILLAKLRLPSTRCTLNFMSLPGVPPVSSEKRSGVSAILGDEVERVERIAQALAHLAALVVAHQAVQVDITEGRLRR